jgi:hypothetical protein
MKISQRKSDTARVKKKNGKQSSVILRALCGEKTGYPQ